MANRMDYLLPYENGGQSCIKTAANGLRIGSKYSMQAESRKSLANTTFSNRFRAEELNRAPSFAEALLAKLFRYVIP